MWGPCRSSVDTSKHPCPSNISSQEEHDNQQAAKVMRIQTARLATVWNNAQAYLCFLRPLYLRNFAAEHHRVADLEDSLQAGGWQRKYREAPQPPDALAQGGPRSRTGGDRPGCPSTLVRRTLSSSSERPDHALTWVSPDILARQCPTISFWISSGPGWIR